MNQAIAVYLVFVLVLAVCINQLLGYHAPLAALVALVGAALIEYIWFLSSGSNPFHELLKSNKEHLESVVPVTNTTDFDQDGDKVLNINLDNDRYSEYGNISLAGDIDTMEQRRIDLDFDSNIGSGSNLNQSLDNSDLVESVVMKHSSNFQPTNAQGVTSTSSATLSNFTLGEPNQRTSGLKYTVPLNDFAYDLDESLSRGQQHRSSINKRAIDGAVRATKNQFQRLFKNELDENEEREWWSAESTKFETDFNSYF